MCPHSPARITPEKHRGEAMLSGHSRVPPGDNKLIWDVFHPNLFDWGSNLIDLGCPLGV